MRQSAEALPAGPLIAFYGDDFTGSSAAMEAAAFAGLPTVLFLVPPTPERVAALAGYRVIGFAGVSRAKSPEWMDQHLPDAFARLAATGAPILHYKVCSTFDSSPQMGSIGRAADIAADLFPGWMPMLVADPAMMRYQAFGHLFARLDRIGYRLDRHPTMSRHPVTPMDESDLGRHLAKQTAKRVGLVDFVEMKAGEADGSLRRQIADGADIVSLDVLDRETLVIAGRLIWENRHRRLFGIGSQGFEAALAAYWREAGLLTEPVPKAALGAAARIVCVSGSVSAVTAAQITRAEVEGFGLIAIDTPLVADERAWQREIERSAAMACSLLAAGRDVIAHTALGPDDPRVGCLAEAAARWPGSSDSLQDRIGAGLGQILDHVLAVTDINRVVIAGGDTSGRSAAMLGIDALTAVAPLAPGAPFCRAHASRAGRDGLEIVLKGGQVGPPDFFVAAKRGS